MKLFLDNLPLGDAPKPACNPGEFFPRVIGYRVSRDGNSSFDWLDIQPVYIPALRIQRRAGQVIIEINSTRPLAYITLQRRPPFFHLFVFPWRQWDKENNDETV